MNSDLSDLGDLRVFRSDSVSRRPEGVIAFNSRRRLQLSWGRAMSPVVSLGMQFSSAPGNAWGPVGSASRATMTAARDMMIVTSRMFEGLTLVVFELFVSKPD